LLWVLLGLPLIRLTMATASIGATGVENMGRR
jgi:hypothetical protein